MPLAEWSPAPTSKFIGFTGFIFTFSWLLLSDDDGFIPILDHANLAFHEAGHVVFGIFGYTPGLYGGTLGQLVFPLVLAFTFMRQGALFSYAFALAWLFQNFFNIARYMADARSQVLPLVGGGEHDWTNILSRWGMLQADTTLANIVTGLGWSGLLLIWLWLLYRWFSADDRVLRY